jgi:hypothetical protein
VYIHPVEAIYVSNKERAEEVRLALVAYDIVKEKEGKREA